MAPPSVDLDALEDDIALYDGLLRKQKEEPGSLDLDFCSFLENHLQGLRSQAKLLQTPSPAPSAAMRPPQLKLEHISRSGSSNSVLSSTSGWSGVAPSQNDNTHSPLINLPNRKRQHDFLDAEFPESKSRRQSPVESPVYTRAPSPATSSGSSNFGYDDPILQSILGSDWEENHKATKEYLQELEDKRRLEAEDAAYARSLQESYTNSSVGSSSSLFRASNPGSSKQSFLDSKGGIFRPMAPPPIPQRPIKLESQQWSYTTSKSSIPYSPLLNSDSDSDIEEIPAAAFVPNSRLAPPQFTNSGSHTSMTYSSPAISSMSGAFPGASSYTGVGGTSVYNQNTYDLTYSPPQPNQFSQNLNFSGLSMPVGLAASLPGSNATPIDIDNYTTRLRDYYGSSDKTEEEIKALLQHIRPDEELNTEERTGTPHQMKIDLMPHQKLGLGWMQKMEAGTNKGGILADDMGLGKTIQALALIVSRPPDEGAHKPTLIVAPVSLLIQWSREAEKVMRPHYRLSVFTLHGETRRTPWHTLKNKHIILTTYGFLASELKRRLAWQEKLKRYPNAQPTANDQCSILGDGSRFHRVILDEAQCIKNKATKASIAAWCIDAEFRWCMTGTPMQNRVDELYSLIRFCRIKPYDNEERFSRDFSRPLKNEHLRDKAMRQLQILCKAILLRRTKTSKIDGKPILSLPPKTTMEARAVFSEDERKCYLALQEKTQLQFNRYLKAGTIGRNYSNMLVLLLRLRQACCHPHLVKDIEINTGGVEGLDLIANARALPKTVVDRLRDLEAFECPVCMDAVPNPLILAPCGHSLCEECLGKLIDQGTTSGDGGILKCVHCRGKLDTLKTTDHHSFLRVHCPEREGVEPLDDPDSAESASDDSTDESGDDEDDDGEDLKDFVVPDDEDIDCSTDEEQKYHPGKTPFEKSKKDPSAGEMTKKKKKCKSKKSKGKRKDKHAHKSLAQLRREGLRNKSAKKAYLRRLEENWQPSAKIEKTLELLDEISASGLGEKTIIFSGFTSFLDLLEVPISRRPDLGSYVRYDGSMTSRDRNEAVLDFTDKPNVRLMLVSLKAGNSGLNLTAANNVIILDPHWNPFVEAQCQDRAHRIGQTRPVTVHRVLIDGEGLPVKAEGATVEDRILAMQEQKRELVESALDENVGKNISRLGVRELGYLFVSQRFSCIHYETNECTRVSILCSRNGTFAYIFCVLVILGRLYDIPMYVYNRWEGVSCYGRSSKKDGTSTRCRSSKDGASTGCRSHK
jgi:SNF2 family DNA or RNA helicase